MKPEASDEDVIFGYMPPEHYGIEPQPPTKNTPAAPAILPLPKGVLGDPPTELAAPDASSPETQVDTPKPSTINDVAKSLHVHPTTVMNALSKDSTITGTRDRRNKNGHAYTHYDALDIERIGGNILPLALPYDSNMEMLAEELGITADWVRTTVRQLGLQATPKRNYAGSGTGNHLSPWQKKQVVQEYTRIPLAEARKDRTYQDIADKACVSITTVYANGPKEPPYRRIPETAFIHPCLPKEEADALERKIAKTPLPAHLVPLGMMAGIVDLTYRGINGVLRRHIDQYPWVEHNLFGPGAPAVCSSWKFLLMLVDKYNFAPGVFEDFAHHMLPEDDAAPQTHKDYAIALQTKYNHRKQSLHEPPKSVFSPKHRLTSAYTPPAPPSINGAPIVPASEIPPPQSKPLAIVLEKLPHPPSEAEAIAFIKCHGGQIDMYGQAAHAWGIAAGLINYNFNPHVYRPQKPGSDWRNRNQLAEETGQPVELIDQYLASLNWRHMHLRAIRLNPDGVIAVKIGDSNNLSRSAVPNLWASLNNSPNAPIIPYWNPAIAAELRAMAKGRLTGTPAIRGSTTLCHAHTQHLTSQSGGYRCLPPRYRLLPILPRLSADAPA